MNLLWTSVALALALCVNGHPAKRSPDVSYGGLEPRHGYQRDHCVPLGLGGPDTETNVWYQPIEEAHRKDLREYQVIEAYCRGEISLQEAKAEFPPERCVPGGW